MAAGRLALVVIVWVMSTLVLAARDATQKGTKASFTLNVEANKTQTLLGVTDIPNQPNEGNESEGVIVFVAADGEWRAVWVRNGTVKDAIEAANVVLAPYDRVKPPLNTRLKNGMNIVVERVQITEERQWEFIQPRTLFQFDSSLPRGKTKLVDPGKVGISEVVVRVYRKDGKVTLRQVLSRAVISEPKPTIVSIGVKRTPMQIACRGTIPSRGMPIGFRVLTMVATGYYPGPESCGRYANGLTATGIKARRGVVAVDPRVIPLGTRLYVEGYGYAIAADTGGAIKGNKIDLCFDTYREAMRWGIRTVRVLVLSTPDGINARDWLRIYRER